jgi:hypothetical protein
VHKEASQTSVIRKKDFAKYQQKKHESVIQKIINCLTLSLPFIITELSQNTKPQWTPIVSKCPTKEKVPKE